MSLSSLPSPWQQKEETRLGAQVSAHWAGWAWFPTRHGLAFPIHCPSLKSHWELASPSPAGGCGAHKVATGHSGIWVLQQSPAAKIPFPSPIPQGSNSLVKFLHAVGCPGEAGWWGAVGCDFPGPQGWGVSCSPIKGTHFPPSSCDSSSPIRKEKKKKTGKKHRRDR